jgi:hypothetical protein
MSKQPIILLGMHRSGTTMITRLLENLGLFVGNEKEINHEALFFYEINNWIFDLHTARPELPYNLRYTNPACEKVILESLNYFLGSRRKSKYLGPLNGKYANIRDIDIPWGWKDPKNTFTIKFWKQIFPGAKVIHIYRNPIDSVSSYIERDLALKNRFEWNWKKKLKREWLISRNFHQNFRLVDIEAGFSLWKEYVSEAVSLKGQFENFLEIRYEDFLADPAGKILELSDFTGIQPTTAQVQEEISQINSDRAYAFTSNPAYVASYQKLKNDPLLKQLGYDAIL